VQINGSEWSGSNDRKGASLFHDEVIARNANFRNRPIAADQDTGDERTFTTFIRPGLFFESTIEPAPSRS
jgi:hypothetical protein